MQQRKRAGKGTEIRIVRIKPPDAITLIKALDAYQASLYPEESNHLDSPETLVRSNTVMFGAVEREEIIAMGAVKVLGDYGEIKRLYVSLDHRGKGLAKRIMTALEKILTDRSVFTARLETGIHQPEAIGLYRALGYRDCGPFGDYLPDPLSRFMYKRLDG